MSKELRTGRRPKLNLDEVMLKMIALLLRHDPQTLNYSKISRFIGVPRATLYYYFGSDLNKTFEEIARFGLKHFTQLDSLDKHTKFSSWEEYQQKRLEQTYLVVERFPWTPRLYFRYRESQGPIGVVIRELEKKYLAGLRTAWKHFHKKELNRDHERIAGSVKLGFLFGVALEIAENREGLSGASPLDRQKLIKKLSGLCTDLLALDT